LKPINWTAGMRPEPWRQLEELYHLALKQDPMLGAGFLTATCQDDADLTRRVESLLVQKGATEVLVDQTATVATTQTLLKPGEALGPYEILGLVGTGGMGEVYSAKDTRLGRKVAIKISHERFNGCFEGEAQAISALNHPNICTLYDVGPNYLVTEFVEGETLSDLLKRALSLECCLDIMRQVLEALCAAHRAGVVHRDLKPQNIMVRFDGYVKVLDFGLAKRMPDPLAVHSESTVTASESFSGQIVGTPAYMSPEQIRGQEVDQRSDLFTVGVILHEMLTGQHPWPCTLPVDTLHAILHDEPPLIDANSPGAEIAPIVRMLLYKNPAERLSSAEAVLEALASCAARQDASAASAASSKFLTSIAIPHVGSTKHCRRRRELPRRWSIKPRRPRRRSRHL
jgi:eukaryotic-like serine/threonine-protein kinase